MIEDYRSLLYREYLLYVLTARKKMSYARFRDTIDSLYRSRVQNYQGVSGGNIAYRVHQALETVGHCNSDFKGGNSDIYVQRPALYRLPVGGSPRAVLVGGRSRGTVPEINARSEEIGEEKIKVHINFLSGSIPFIPTRILIEAADEESLREIARGLEIEYRSTPPAYKLAESVGSLDEHLETLGESRTGELKGWPERREYRPAELRFRKEKSGGEGLSLVRYKHPKTSQTHFFLFRDGKRQEVDREWGRYAVLKNTTLRPIIFDQEKMCVVIPNGARLPTAHARALGLCSGYPPRFVNADEISIRSALRIPYPEKFGYHLYQWVPSSVVDSISSSLGQNVLNASIGRSGRENT